MAQIYTMCGMFEEAIEELEIVLQQEARITVNYIKLLPDLEPLHNMPAFQTLMSKYALKQPS